MKQFDSLGKNVAYAGYRMVLPFFDPINTAKGIVGYPGYVRDLMRYASLDPATRISLLDVYPMLNEKTSLTPFDAHYYFQTVWFLHNILDSKPKRHVDVGSAYQLSGILSLLTKTEFVDIRPIDTKLKNLKIVRGDILNLPYRDKSISSLSSLHVVEHIGLGRYGDPIDPMGTMKACRELARALKPGGKFYLSLPIGKARICFNAHRVTPPDHVLKFCDTLKLKSFSVVDDNGKFFENQDPNRFRALSYGCGMFCFTK